MEKDLDEKMYNDYLNGEKQAFEYLYKKYKNRLEYFIYNIVKDYQKAEDLTQETFIYVMQNKLNEKSSFKYFIYLVAKSKAYNYIKVEKRRNEISKMYSESNNEQVENDILEVITKEENRKELLEALELLEERYRNAIYLVNIESFSYEEASKILGESLQNIKNLIHRGKIQLRKILLKKGLYEMNKFIKMFIIVICIGVLLSGVAYATIKIVKKITNKAQITPTYTSKISTIDNNKVWVGTFNLVWNDFMNDVIGGKVEFEDGYSELANELNKQIFTTEQLSKNSYFKIHGNATFNLKEQIESGIKNYFNEHSEILDKVDWENEENYILYAMLKKEFNYLEKFPTLSDSTFGNSEEKIKYFGIDKNTSKNASKNIEILFYNSKEDFAVKLKTQEGEEVYLYRATGENKSFEENYKEMMDKKDKYIEEKTFEKNDILKIPFINVRDDINYDELCGRYIKGTCAYIKQAIQTINFELNNYGGSIKSEALIEETQGLINEVNREFIFNDDFLLYLKEQDKQQPYFALKIDDIDVLELASN